MKLAEVLEQYNLYDQVFMGIDKYFSNESIKELILARIDNCDFKYFDSSVTSAGTCYNSHKIRIHELLKFHIKDLKNTLLHEVGHLIKNISDEFYYSIQERGEWKRRSPHGKEWKEITKAIGGIPKATGNFPYLRKLKKQRAKHKYTCLDCKKEYLTLRKLKNIHLRRCKCGGRIRHKQLR